MPDTTWQDHAACLNQPTEVFFETPDDHATADAIRICAGCPVIHQCLDSALAAERGQQYLYGVFGGLTAAQRRRMLRARSRVKTATSRGQSRRVGAS